MHRNEPLSPNTAVLAISQSGETADTRGQPSRETQLIRGVAIRGSTIDQITKAEVSHCRAGKVSVASTKGLYLAGSFIVLAEKFALALSKKTMDGYGRVIALPAKIEQILQDTSSY